MKNRSKLLTITFDIKTLRQMDFDRELSKSPTQFLRNCPSIVCLGRKGKNRRSVTQACISCPEDSGEKHTVARCAHGPNHSKATTAARLKVRKHSRTEKFQFLYVTMAMIRNLKDVFGDMEEFVLSRWSPIVLFGLQGRHYRQSFFYVLVGLDLKNCIG